MQRDGNVWTVIFYLEVIVTSSEFPQHTTHTATKARVPCSELSCSHTRSVDSELPVGRQPGLFYVLYLTEPSTGPALSEDLAVFIPILKIWLLIVQHHWVECRCASLN